MLVVFDSFKQALISSYRNAVKTAGLIYNLKEVPVRVFLSEDPDQDVWGLLKEMMEGVDNPAYIQVPDIRVERFGGVYNPEKVYVSVEIHQSKVFPDETKVSIEVINVNSREKYPSHEVYFSGVIQPVENIVFINDRVPTNVPYEVVLVNSVKRCLVEQYDHFDISIDGFIGENHILMFKGTKGTPCEGLDIVRNIKSVMDDITSMGLKNGVDVNLTVKGVYSTKEGPKKFKLKNNVDIV